MQIARHLLMHRGICVETLWYCHSGRGTGVADGAKLLILNEIRLRIACTSFSSQWCGSVL